MFSETARSMDCKRDIVFSAGDGFKAMIRNLLTDSIQRG